MRRFFFRVGGRPVDSAVSVAVPSWLAYQTPSWLANQTPSWLANQTSSWLASQTPSWLVAGTCHQVAGSPLTGGRYLPPKVIVGKKALFQIIVFVLMNDGGAVNH